MKTRSIIGGIIAVIGIMVAIGTKDGSNHEILCRAIGIAAFIGGALVARAFDFQKD